MQSINNTYFPTSRIGLRDFSESLIYLISDFDVHAMFNVDELLGDWTNEFDFRKTYYSTTSNFEIDVTITTGQYFNYRLLYNSSDFSINVNYETFADMVNGILQVTINGLEDSNHLVDRINDFCEKTQTKKVVIKSQESPGSGAPDFDQPHGVSEPKLKSLEKRPVNKRKRIQKTYTADGEGSIVYTFSIDEKTITIGEFDRMNTQGGGARSYSFKDFIENKSGQGFVLSHFDDGTLQKIITTVKGLMQVR